MRVGDKIKAIDRGIALPNGTQRVVTGVIAEIRQPEHPGLETAIIIVKVDDNCKHFARVWRIALSALDKYYEYTIN